MPTAIHYGIQMHDVSQPRNDLLTNVAKRPFLNIRRGSPNAAMPYPSQRTFQLHSLYGLCAHEQFRRNRFALLVSDPSYSF